MDAGSGLRARMIDGESCATINEIRWQLTIGAMSSHEPTEYGRENVQYSFRIIASIPRNSILAPLRSKPLWVKFYTFAAARCS